MAKEKKHWTRWTYITGVILMITGAIDPLEGAVIIAAGSILTALATFLMNDRHRTVFMACCIAILSGVLFLFYFSSLGGIGGNSRLSAWWGLLILPYPFGWLTTMVLLISRWVKNNNSRLPADN